jgi:hypothetical protein
MTKSSKAWVWSQYKAVLTEDNTGAAPLRLFGSSPTADGVTSSTKRIKWGASLTVAMLVGLLFPKIALLLLIFAVLLILSGLDPKRFEDFCNQIPGGNVILKALDLWDAILP